MVIDEALADWKHASMYAHPELIRRMKAALTHAKRFVLDTESSRLLGRFAEDCVDLIIKHRQFARPMYDTMYIEFDTDAFYGAFSGVGSMKKDDPDRDIRVGFLLDYHFVYTVSHGAERSSIMPCFQYVNERGKYDAPAIKPFEIYDFNYVATDITVPSIGVLMNKAHMYAYGGITCLSLMFGNSVVHNPKFVNQTTLMPVDPDLEGLANEVSYYYAMNMDPTKFPSTGHERMLQEIVGDIRNLYAILLWLNSLPHSVKYVNMPAGHRILRGKRVAMSAHNVVTIHMHGSQQVRNMFQRAMKNRQKPREHDVRGFWRHHGGIAQGCGHIWPDEPDKRHKYVCSRCQRERWWVNSHKRGDKSRGVVDKEYKVEV